MNLKNCLPFSEIDKFLGSINGDVGCLTDTSFLISLGDKDNHFHEDALFMQEKLADYGVRIFASVIARSEFIDWHRRTIMTETLMDMLVPTSKWRISSAVREELRSQRGWVDNQLRSGNDPYLTDSRIKECKQVFLPKTQSGQTGWVELCRHYLGGKLFAAWAEIVAVLQLHYVDMPLLMVSC